MSASSRLNKVQSQLATSTPNMSSSPPSSSSSSSSDPPTRFPAHVVPHAPEDPLFGLMAAYRADTDERKVDLGIGAYRDDNAKPWVLPVVKKADALLRADPDLNHEYLPITGLPAFTSAAARLILGASSAALGEQRVSSIQTISGTGAVHLGALLLSKFPAAGAGAARPTVYISEPTWANHGQILGNVGLPVATYAYFDAATRGLDFAGMCADLSGAAPGSVVVLHACAHNPTGVDPTPAQWARLATLMRARALFPFFDCAYQGFASGDPGADAAPIRTFVAAGFELCIAQSFSKNLGLYGERAGAFHFVAAPGPGARDTAARLASQLARLQRAEISNPPAYGARVAARVLTDPALCAAWHADLGAMSGRIRDMRRALRARLEDLGTPGSWAHITEQIGMFSYTGLSADQVARLRAEAHVYMTTNGRISMAGLNTRNLDYFARAVDRVVRETTPAAS